MAASGFPPEQHLRESGDNQDNESQITQWREAFTQSLHQLIQSRLISQNAVDFGDDQQGENQNTANPDNRCQNMKKQADCKKRLGHYDLLYCVILFFFFFFFVVSFFFFFFFFN
eukprot:TRINITY_DN4248_c1_g1_i1.p1 TRINITY_DN4248_c1_g1~~TRINITY_DN4248_c1_g1_i1.p1  ORF type:complete len:128 (-),score=9.95 TRINITY_DN4248_c1_g1_i1:69-410(-)